MGDSEGESVGESEGRSVGDNVAAGSVGLNVGLADGISVAALLVHCSTRSNSMISSTVQEVCNNLP